LLCDHGGCIVRYLVQLLPKNLFSHGSSVFNQRSTFFSSFLIPKHLFIFAIFLSCMCKFQAFCDSSAQFISNLSRFFWLDSNLPFCFLISFVIFKPAMVHSCHACWNQAQMLQPWDHSPYRNLALSHSSYFFHLSFVRHRLSLEPGEQGLNTIEGFCIKAYSNSHFYDYRNCKWGALKEIRGCRLLS